jgi:hypothetical protein
LQQFLSAALQKIQASYYEATACFQQAVASPRFAHSVEVFLKETFSEHWVG